MRVFALHVAFSLTISKGVGAGEAQSFEAEARLGRTADNDVVVKDQAASRSHARVYAKGGRHFLEDLGSANGTRLNNATVKQPKELKDGDAIMIGDTVFDFAVEHVEAEAEAAPSSTMDESAMEESANPFEPEMTQLPKSRPAGRRAAPPDSTSADESADDELSDASAEVNSTKFVDVPKPRALTNRRSAVRPSGVRRGAAEQEEPSEEVEMTAAERARERRVLQQSAGGKATLMWRDLPRGLRVVLSFVGTVLVLGSIGFAAFVVWPRQRINRPEPKSFAADGTLIEDSFGEGEVTFRTADQKAFSFAATSPTRIVGVLHYQAANISSDEVTLNLNGLDLGTVPPDNIDVDSRELDVILPAATLKPRDENLIIFDNVRNPPGDDEWKIWNLWVEIIPVPEMSAEEARRRAADEIEKASKAYEMREVGAENLFRAWKTFREAWLLLEATPDAPPELLTLSRTRMREIRPELDRKCNAMIVKFKSIVNTRPDAVAEGRQVLENIPEHFPTREHPCFNFSRSLLRTIDGFDDFENAGAAAE